MRWELVVEERVLDLVQRLGRGRDAAGGLPRRKELFVVVVVGLRGIGAWCARWWPMPLQREGRAGRCSVLERATWRSIAARLASSEAALLVCCYCSLQRITFAPAHARRTEMAYHLPLTRVRNETTGCIYFFVAPPAGRAALAPLAVVSHVRVFNNRNGTAGGFLVQFRFVFSVFLMTPAPGRAANGGIPGS